MAQDELFPIIDEDGNVIGKATRRECHSGSMLLHPVVHLHVFNSKGELYLQKRSLSKDIQPGKWDTAVGGHVDYGEEIETALRREAREELGITDYTPSSSFATHTKAQGNARSSTTITAFTTVISTLILSRSTKVVSGQGKRSNRRSAQEYSLHSSAENWRRFPHCGIKF